MYVEHLQTNQQEIGNATSIDLDGALCKDLTDSARQVKRELERVNSRTLCLAEFCKLVLTFLRAVLVANVGGIPGGVMGLLSQYGGRENFQHHFNVSLSTARELCRYIVGNKQTWNPQHSNRLSFAAVSESGQSCNFSDDGSDFPHGEFMDVAQQYLYVVEDFLKLSENVTTPSDWYFQIGVWAKTYDEIVCCAHRNCKLSQRRILNCPHVREQAFRIGVALLQRVEAPWDKISGNVNNRISAATFSMQTLMHGLCEMNLKSQESQDQILEVADNVWSITKKCR